MMKCSLATIYIILFCGGLFAQTDLQRMLDAEKAFHQAAANVGMKSAFLDFLADDAIIFNTAPVNGREFWKFRNSSSTEMLVRQSSFGDIAANGMMGYTTGNWELYPKGRSAAPAKFGQYVTIWEKKPDGTFRASLDIDITHDKFSTAEIERKFKSEKGRDSNKQGRSAADASMNFLRASMSDRGLSEAYEKFAAKDVRFLREQDPPILGRKNAVSETKNYISVEFPTKIALYETADMAYSWNACIYANSLEGTEKGNCLQIWKLRKKEWQIVVGVFARVPNETLPTLKVKEKSRKSR